MIQRKRKTKEPCPGCRLHPTLCMCTLIPQIETRTRLCLVIHAKELKRTTNTGRLAIQVLKNSVMKIRGAEKEVLDLSATLCPEYRSVLFYPSEDAQEFDAAFVAQDSRPLQLIVPDGNWRQASKVNTRHAELKDLPRVKISTANKATRHLRKEHMEEGLATLEAIAQAFAIAESPEAGQTLQKVYEEKLKRTLQGRNLLAREI